MAEVGPGNDRHEIATRHGSSTRQRHVADDGSLRDALRHHPQIPPSRRMAGEDQHLMPLRRVVQHPFHLPQPVVIGVHQSIVQDQQGGPAGFLQQVGVREPRHDAHLLARAHAQFLEIAALLPMRADAGDGAGRKVVGHFDASTREQDAQVMVQVFLQRSAQATGQG